MHNDPICIALFCFKKMQKKLFLNHSSKYNQTRYTYVYVNNKQVSIIKSNENSVKPLLEQKTFFSPFILQVSDDCDIYFHFLPLGSSFSKKFFLTRPNIFYPLYFLYYFDFTIISYFWQFKVEILDTFACVCNAVLLL